MLNPYTRYISAEKCIIDWHHLAFRHELAEGNQLFRTRCESTVRHDSPCFFLNRAQCETAFIVHVTTTLSAFEKVFIFNTPSLFIFQPYYPNIMLNSGM